jgi:N,N'-diacetyllegionaminate synthase
MYNILEVANTHGGGVHYIYELLKEFDEFTKKNGVGIKFQPFKYDESALSDFSYYDIYKELFISQEDWSNIIEEAFKTKDIWIDLFDKYSTSILQENLDKVFGIKLQTSVLDNTIIFQTLKNIDLSDKKLIINIAGRSKEDIKILINKYTKQLNIEELLIEVGFQAYPTRLEDSGLMKVKYLKEHYDNKIVFADHIDGEDEGAVLLPLIALLLGADYIEKHIMHSHLETRYDYNSSVKYEVFKKLHVLQDNYTSLQNKPFISNVEANYLNATCQTPLLNKNIESQSLINADKDLIFRRSNSSGLSTKDINKLISDCYILTSSKKKYETLKKEDFKKANIAAIIACRLKSTRLPRKALLKVGKVSSIELSIKNTMKFNNLNHIILATSTEEQDAELENYTYNDNIIFHRGHPDDVIDRYLDVINSLNIDVFVRLTGDNVFISSDIFDILLKSHFEEGADYTTANTAAVGTNLEIINASALKKVNKYFPLAEHSEYMSWYFHNNPEYFKINKVDLPEKLVRDYRLTLDYPEDLEVFNHIEKYFIDNNIEYDLEELFKFLDENPKVANINSHLTPKYESNKDLIVMLDKETKIRQF